MKAIVYDAPRKFEYREVEIPKIKPNEILLRVHACNGLANPIWRQMVADVLNRPLCQGTGEQASERAGVGAAMIAGIGSCVLNGYQDARKLAPVFNVATEPNQERARLYEFHYRNFLERRGPWSLPQSR
jgi:sugar (pentulose or hexulose) kinase